MVGHCQVDGLVRDQVAKYKVRREDQSQLKERFLPAEQFPHFVRCPITYIRWGRSRSLAVTKASCFSISARA
jgi:hypothetical protein